MKRLEATEGKQNTCLVVREAELLSTADELLHYLDEDGDRARAHEHFGVQLDEQLLWCSIE